MTRWGLLLVLCLTSATDVRVIEDQFGRARAAITADGPYMVLDLSWNKTKDCSNGNLYKVVLRRESARRGEDDTVKEGLRETNLVLNRTHNLLFWSNFKVVITEKCSFYGSHSTIKIDNVPGDLLPVTGVTHEPLNKAALLSWELDPQQEVADSVLVNICSRGEGGCREETGSVTGGSLQIDELVPGIVYEVGVRLKKTIGEHSYFSSFKNATVEALPPDEKEFPPVSEVQVKIVGSKDQNAAVGDADVKVTTATIEVSYKRPENHLVQGAWSGVSVKVRDSHNNVLVDTTDEGQDEKIRIPKLPLMSKITVQLRAVYQFQNETVLSSSAERTIDTKLGDLEIPIIERILAIDDTKVLLEWQHFPIQGHNVTYDVRGVIDAPEGIQCSESCHAVVENLKPSTHYTFRIAALVFHENKPYKASSEPKEIKTLEEGALTPHSLEVKEIRPDAVSLQWDVVMPENPDACNFEVDVNLTNTDDTKPRKLFPEDVREAEIEFFKFKHQTVTVSTVCKYYDLELKEPSIPLNVFGSFKPSAVQDFSVAVVDDSNLKVFYTVLEDEAPFIEGFRIQWREKGDEHWREDKTSSKEFIVLKNLVADTEYELTVAPFTKDGNGVELDGDFAEPKTATTKEPTIDKPEITKLISIDGSRALIEWTHSAKEGFDVKYTVSIDGERRVGEMDVHGSEGFYAVIEDLESGREYPGVTIKAHFSHRGREYRNVSAPAHLKMLPQDALVAKLSHETITDRSSMQLIWNVTLPEGESAEKCHFELEVCLEATAEGKKCLPGENIESTLRTWNTAFFVYEHQHATLKTVCDYREGVRGENTSQPLKIFGGYPFSPVQNLRVVEADHKSISISFEAASVDSEFVDRYTVSWKVSGSLGQQESSTTETNFVIENLQPATKYEVAVQAVSDESSGRIRGEWAYVDGVTKLVVDKPHIKKLFSIDATRALVEWEHTPQEGFDNYYVVSYEGDGDEKHEVRANETYALLTDLQPGSEYRVKLTAHIKHTYGEESETSDEATLKTLSEGALKATLRHESPAPGLFLGVAWDIEMPADPSFCKFALEIRSTDTDAEYRRLHHSNVDHESRSYRVKFFPFKKQAITLVTRCRYHSDVEAEGESEPLVWNGEFIPSRVTNLLVGATDNGSLLVEFKQEPDEADYVDSYNVRWRHNGAGEWMGNINDSRTTFSIEGLEEGTPYEVSVAPVAKDTTGEEVSAVAHTKPIIDPPTISRVMSIDEYSALIEWTHNSSRSTMSLDFEYRVTWEDGNEVFLPEDQNGIYFGWNELVPGREYEVSVTAWTKFQEQPLQQSSETKTLKMLPKGALKAQLNLLPVESGLNLTVNWTADLPDDPSKCVFKPEICVKLEECEQGAELKFIENQWQTEFVPFMDHRISLYTICTYSKDNVVKRKSDLLEFFGNFTPSAIQEVQAKVENGSVIHLSFEVNPREKQHIKGFRVRHKAQGAKVLMESTAYTTTHVIDEINPGTDYEVLVAAFAEDKSGNRIVGPETKLSVVNSVSAEQGGVSPWTIAVAAIGASVVVIAVIFGVAIKRKASRIASVNIHETSVEMTRSREYSGV